jgi:HPt (histidine-containing phosphotransfer) domain-containing protein
MMKNRFETVNLSYLNEISGGDTSFQKELIGIFLNQIPEFMLNMNQFLEKNEIENLAKEAHTAKSSVLIFMMDEAGKTLKQVQLLAENHQTEQIPFLLAKVGIALENAFRELTVFLDETTELSYEKPGSVSNW